VIGSLLESNKSSRSLLAYLTGCPFKPALMDYYRHTNWSQAGSPSLGLATWAVETGSLFDFHSQDGGCTSNAGLAFTSVNLQLAGKIPGMAILSHKIPQRGATSGNGTGEYGNYCKGKRLILHHTHLPGVAIRA
jgi:hypothetical protein